MPNTTKYNNKRKYVHYIILLFLLCSTVSYLILFYFDLPSIYLAHLLCFSLVISQPTLTYFILPCSTLFYFVLHLFCLILPLYNLSHSLYLTHSNQLPSTCTSHTLQVACCILQLSPASAHQQCHSCHSVALQCGGMRRTSRRGKAWKFN